MNEIGVIKPITWFEILPNMQPKPVDSEFNENADNYLFKSFSKLLCLLLLVSAVAIVVYINIVCNIIINISIDNIMPFF